MIYLDLNSSNLVRVVCSGGDTRTCRVWVMTDTCHCDCEFCRVSMHYDCKNDGMWPKSFYIGEPGCMLEEVDECGVSYYLGDLGIEDMIYGSTGEWTYAPDGAALADMDWEDGVPVLTPWTET